MGSRQSMPSAIIGQESELNGPPSYETAARLEDEGTPNLSVGKQVLDHSAQPENVVPRASNAPPIGASDVPQWTWSNAQCQEWVTVVLPLHGPGLWRLNAKDWHVWFGIGGGAMFDLMFAMYKARSPGSVPAQIRYAHFETDAGSSFPGFVAKY